MRPIQQSVRHRLSMLATGVLFCVLCTSIPVLAAQTDPGGGIGGTGITGFGVVQKFGSIFVNGREFFFDESTRVSREGVPISKESLHLGDVVIVQGYIGKKPGAGTIAQVDVRIALQGRVQDADEKRGTFQVLGQTVRVGAGTYGAPGTTAFSVGHVRVGEMVAVSGLMRADGAWMATRVEPLRTPGVSEFIVRGSVAAVDRDKGALTLGKQSFAIAHSGLDTDIRRGAGVRIAGFYDHERAIATTIRSETPLATAAGRLIEMSGYVQASSSAGEARANDVTLRYNPETIVVNGRAGDLQTNTPVAVRGELNVDGSISVHEMVINVDPHEVVLPELETVSRPLGISEHHEKAEMEKPQTERPEVDKPEMEKPEIEKPEIEKPEIEHAELPMMGQ